MTDRLNEHDQSFNLDDLDDLISNEENGPIPQMSQVSACVTQVQSISLCREKSLLNEKENIKTSIVPGPLGRLPILNTEDEIKRLKEDKTARDKILTNDENSNAKRTKTPSDLFSLNINNYPSYAVALQQLKEIFSCEPISIETALIKARLGIKKRIPLMCTTVTHYDRQENTILLDKSAHIRATFIGDDDLLDEFNIRIGHTLVLRNVAVFTSTRRRHHYVNIHVQNIIALQDPLLPHLTMPVVNHDSASKLLENEIVAYADSSTCPNDTFHIFSQSDQEDEDQPPLKKHQTTNAGFAHIKSKPAASTVNKFQKTIPPNQPVKPVVTSTITVVQSNQPVTSTITVAQSSEPVKPVATPSTTLARSNEADKPGTPTITVPQANEQPALDSDLNIEDFNSDFFSDW